MARKTIEYRGEFKVDVKFSMTSDENINDETIEKVKQILQNDTFEEIQNGLNYWFNDDGVDNLEVNCEEIDNQIRTYEC